MNNKVKKVVTYLVALAVCMSSFQWAGKSISARQKEEVNIQTEKYVVISDKANLDKAIASIDETYEIGKENNCSIYSFDASKKEAEKLKNMQGVTISKDIMVSASGEKSKNKIKNRDKKQIKNNKIEWNKKIINDSKSVQNVKRSEIDIAILDSGIDFSDDINVVESKDFVTEGNENNIFSDITGHGTSIAGIIASSGNTEAIGGINSNVNIYSARILDENNNAPVSRVVESIYWAIEKNVDIINISFGTMEDSDVLREAIKRATDEGILVIAAAGNTGDDVQFPAAYEKVMAVGAVDSTGKITDFSADGKEVDVMAPGEDVKSVGAFGGSIIVSGTSISAPHVVGLASLLWSKDKSVSADFIKSLIIRSANKTENDKSYKGIIDVDYALAIYDTYKKEYYNTIAETDNVDKDVVVDKIAENDNVIHVSKNNYVTGTWTAKGHENAVSYAGNFWELTPIQIKILKLGIAYPDQKFGGMSENPQWHTASVTKYNNYISNYRCATKIAFALKKGKAVNTTNIAKPKDMTNTDYQKMVKQVSSISWNKSLLGNNSVTNARKGYFVMGMALHVLTDSFAHQAYMYNSNRKKWEYLNHKDDQCDDYTKTKYQNRFYCAKQAAKEALACYFDSAPEYGDHWEYVVNYQDFKLKRLKTYVTKQETYNANTFGEMSSINKGNKD